MTGGIVPTTQCGESSIVSYCRLYTSVASGLLALRALVGVYTWVARWQLCRLAIRCACVHCYEVFRQVFHEDRGGYLHMAFVLSPVCCGSFQLPHRESKPIHGVQQHHPPGLPGIQGGWLEGLRLGLSASSVSSTRGRLVSPQPAVYMLVHSTVMQWELVSLLFGAESLKCTLPMGVDVTLPLGTPGRVTGDEGDSFICLSWNVGVCHFVASSTFSMPSF